MLLLINKPPGLSSYDVIRVFKRKTQFKGKVGHAGTLDPFANGLLILLLDSSTKLFKQFQTFSKTYIAGCRLGYKTATLDIEGKITKGIEKQLNKDEIIKQLNNFIGQITQTVPIFSAKRYKGKRLYKYGQEGKTISITNQINVFNIKLLNYLHPLIFFQFQVSSGTYIRQLCVDILQSLDNDCFVYYLTRTQIGPFSLKSALSLEDLNSDNWRSNLLDPSAFSFPE
ncbi:MAG: hypothetical protein KatS3mg090_0143 [Patescibacteria group bacterium]|nr:MAG: hypothetical protein KatS3mg090_0143 [Patescibacteria group bacterium]